ncbi:MAG: DUF4352 domain-containing protein [Cyclobacteriaceae bacterium]|nr:DUF4352 domain-containing protein [Cyclobacteriaceae bacterium]
MKTSISFFAILIVATSCYSTFQTNKTLRDYDEKITFKIDQVQEGGQISTGNSSIRPSRGYKFVFVFFTFTNNTSSKLDLNFDNILLVDIENKIKYKPEFSMRTGPVNLMGRIDSFILANDSKSRKLVFLFPKDRKAEYLIVNDKLIQIDYK